MKFSIKDFFSKCDQIRRFLWIWSHLLKKSLMENFIFCAVWENSSLRTTYHFLILLQQMIHTGYKHFPWLQQHSGEKKKSNSHINMANKSSLSIRHRNCSAVDSQINLNKTFQYECNQSWKNIAWKASVFRVFLVRIQSECGKIQTRKNSEYGQFSCRDRIVLFSEFQQRLTWHQRFVKAAIKWRGLDRHSINVMKTLTV